MIQVESEESVGLNIGIRSERIERRSSSPEICIECLFGKERLCGNNSAENKNQDKRADKAGAEFESEPGNLPSHSLRTTLSCRRFLTIRSGPVCSPVQVPNLIPGKHRGSCSKFRVHSRTEIPLIRFDPVLLFDIVKLFVQTPH